MLATAYARLRGEQRIRHQALHDPLTRLANRVLCRDRLEQALAHAERSGSAAAVLFVDVDDFKRVNDLYGHATGDKLLVALARRLAATVRPGDTVARMGGDEFVVVCGDVDERVALALGRRVAAAMNEPLEVAGTEHRLSASVGIALGSGADCQPGGAGLQRRRGRLPGQGGRAAAGSRSSTSGCAAAPWRACAPRPTSRARWSAASWSWRSSRSSRSPTGRSSAARRCCAGAAAAAARSPRPSSSRSPRSRG